MQEVGRENLVPGKEYYLECCFAPPSKPYKMIGTFEQLSQGPYLPAKLERTCFTNFRMIKHRSDPTHGYRIELALHWRFYEIQRDKIQKNMENRAYNQVLLDLIQDEYFKPVVVI